MKNSLKKSDKKDLKTIIENFGQFENALGEYNDLIGHLADVVDLFNKNKVKHEEIAKKLLNRHIGGNYNKEQLRYLSCQINDFDFIKKRFSQEHIETDIVLLERLAQIDKEKSLMFIKTKKELLGRHWTKIVPLFNFLKAYYPKHIIETYVKDNQETFKTSSHLKKHLKEECGVFISQREGNLVVEVKNDKNWIIKR